MVDMAYGVLDDVLVVLNTSHLPSAQEWSGFVELYASTKVRFPEVKRLVFSDGGGPDAAQRSALNKILAGVPSHCAVVTDSVLARGVVKAFGIFDRTIRAYPPKDWRVAMSYLGLDESKVADARALVRQLDARVGKIRVVRGMLDDERSARPQPSL